MNNIIEENKKDNVENNHELTVTVPCQLGDTLYCLKKTETEKGTEIKIVSHVARKFEILALQRFVIDEEGNRHNFKMLNKEWFLSETEALRGIDFS